MAFDSHSTLYYYLSVPEEDVELSTGWNENLHDGNRLHLTAVGQVLAFTLQALRAPTQDSAWINRTKRSLETLYMNYDDLLDEISEKDIPSSAFKSPQNRNGYLRVSPVKPDQGPLWLLLAIIHNIRGWPPTTMAGTSLMQMIHLVDSHNNLMCFIHRLSQPHRP